MGRKRNHNASRKRRFRKIKQQMAKEEEGSLAPVDQVDKLNSKEEKFTTGNSSSPKAKKRKRSNEAEDTQTLTKEENDKLVRKRLKQRRRERRKMTQTTRRGQPIMKCRIKNLLNKIEKSLNE